MTRYTAGWNLPGCLPDGCEPGIFDTPAEALVWLIEEARMAATSESEEIDWAPMIAELLEQEGAGCFAIQAPDGYNWWIEEYEDDDL